MNIDKIGEEIRKIRLLRGYSQEALAEKIGVSYQQIQKYEKGDSELKINRLESIAEALDVPLFELIHLSSSELSDPKQKYKGRNQELFQLTKDEQDFLKLYRKIKSPELRKSIIALIKSLPKETD
jgi:transcriptional regulator with XRE-family HTH domain